MRERYVDELKEMIQTEHERYRIFKDNFTTLSTVFDNTVTASMKLPELVSAANEMDIAELENSFISEREVETTADIYDNLGIISSERQTLTGEKVYKAPDYHGRGGSKSWNDIEEELHQATEEAEKRHSWEVQRIGPRESLEDYK